jgi:hypothetical protein
MGWSLCVCKRKKSGTSEDKAAGEETRDARTLTVDVEYSSNDALAAQNPMHTDNEKSDEMKQQIEEEQETIRKMQEEMKEVRAIDNFSKAKSKCVFVT